MRVQEHQYVALFKGDVYLSDGMNDSEDESAKTSDDY